MILNQRRAGTAIFASFDWFARRGDKRILKVQKNTEMDGRQEVCYVLKKGDEAGFEAEKAPAEGVGEIVKLIPALIED